MPYFYRNHLNGNIYSRDYELEYDELYCETCGDSDDYLGYFETEAEAYEYLNDDLEEDIPDSLFYEVATKEFKFKNYSDIDYWHQTDYIEIIESHLSDVYILKFAKNVKDQWYFFNVSFTELDKKLLGIDSIIENLCYQNNIKFENVWYGKNQEGDYKWFLRQVQIPNSKYEDIFNKVVTSNEE